MIRLDTLFEQARAGDAKAWDDLLGRLRPIIWALCRRHARDDADASSATQNILLRVHGGFANFRGTSVPQLIAWIRKITANELIDRGRRPAPAGPLTIEVPASGPDVGTELSRAEEIARLTAAMESLPEPYRGVAVARLIQQLSCAAIAQQMGRTEVWVRVTCMRAVRRLREELGESS
jgi:RNA polymerase sigma-70 factor (ECF subfamily)